MGDEKKEKILSLLFAFDLAYLPIFTHLIFYCFSFQPLTSDIELVPMPKGRRDSTTQFDVTV